MRLDDINAFIDAKRVYDRAYRRAFGEPDTCTIYLDSVDEFREAATVTDSHIGRSDVPDENFSVLRFCYRNVEFCYVAKRGEVA